MKDLASVFEPDPRNTGFVKLDPKSGVTSHMTIADHYEIISGIQLCPGVPDDVRSCFEMVKSLVLYAWLYYPFFTMAHIHVALAIEMALRIRLPKSGKDVRGLADLFDEAEKQGVIGRKDFQSDPFRRLRNSFIHPRSQSILPPSYAIDMLTLSAELLNKLWPTC